jgi:transposase
VVIIIDNAKYHHALLHKTWREEAMPRFRLDFLPPYSPDLNPIERVWKVTRRLCLHNVYFPKLEFERVNPRLVSIGRRCPSLFDYVAYSPSSSDRKLLPNNQAISARGHSL